MGHILSECLSITVTCKHGHSGFQSGLECMTKSYPNIVERLYFGFLLGLILSTRRNMYIFTLHWHGSIFVLPIPSYSHFSELMTLSWCL